MFDLLEHYWRIHHNWLQIRTKMTNIKYENSLA